LFMVEFLKELLKIIVCITLFGLTINLTGLIFKL